MLYRAGSNEFKEIPLMFQYEENSRGLGLADMAKAIQTVRKPLANNEQTLHVLEIMTSFQTSSEQGKHIAIESKYQRDKPMAYDLLKGVLD